MDERKTLLMDETNGAIRLSGFTPSIHVDMTREDFEKFASTSFGADAKLTNQSNCEPFRTFRFCVNMQGDETLHVQLQYCESMLSGVTLCVDSKSFGTSWNDWSQESEMLRKTRHDELLAASGVVNERKYAWGAACSFYDERSGGSSIYITYSKNADAIKQICRESR